MYQFSQSGFIIMFVTLLLCLVVFFYSRAKIKNRIQRERKLTDKRWGVIWITVGSIISVIAIIFHIYLQLDFLHTPKILRPISALTIEPAIVLTIMLLLLGLTLLFIGIFSIRVIEKGKNK